MRQFSDSADLESQLTALMSAHRTSLVRLAYLYLGDSCSGRGCGAGNLSESLAASGKFP